MHFNANGIRDVADLRVLQYRRDYLNKTPTFGDREMQSALMLIDVAYLRENDSNLIFFDGDKDGIWPSMYVWCPLSKVNLHLLILVGYIPYDGTARTKMTTIALPVTITLSIINAIGIIFAVICLLFNIIYRKRRFNSCRSLYTMHICVYLMLDHARIANPFHVHVHVG